MDPNQLHVYMLQYAQATYHQDIFSVFVCCGFVLVSILLLIVFRKDWQDPFEHPTTFLNIAAVVALLVGLMIGLSSYSEAIQIHYAPDAWIVSHIGKLLE